MDSFLPVDISATGLDAQRLRMAVISSNLANVDSTRVDGVRMPYQRRQVVMQSQPLADFREALAAQLDDSDSTSKGVMEQSRGVLAATRIDRLTPFREAYEPGHPDADPETGIVRYPNVSVIQEMTDLVAASHAYEANLAAMRTSLQMVERAMAIAV